MTRFTLKTFPQTQVWGGIVTYSEEVIPAVKAALTKFVGTVTDPKASIITAFNAVPGQVIAAQMIFYDGPNPPAGLFDAFIDIEPLSTDISTRSFLSLVQSTPANLTYGQRNTFDTTPILDYTPTVIDAIINETVVRCFLSARLHTTSSVGFSSGAPNWLIRQRASLLMQLSPLCPICYRSTPFQVHILRHAIVVYRPLISATLGSHQNTTATLLLPPG